MMGYDHDNPIISSEHYNKDDDYTPDFLPPLTPSNHSSIAPPFDNTTTTSFSSSDDYISPAWAWLALLLLCVCLKPRTRDASYYIRQERIRQAAERPPPFVEAHNPEQRKQAIDQCLITKTIMDCDKHGNLILGHDDDVESKLAKDDDDDDDDDTVSLSSIEYDENASACVICLEPFRIGDAVTWSRDTTTCQHVFHHDCITEWLQLPKHDDCPSCRHALLKFDNTTTTIDAGQCEEEPSCCEQQDDNGENQVHHSSRPLAFIIINGLVSQVRRASCCTAMNGNEQVQELCCESVSPPTPLRRVVSEGHGLAHASLAGRAAHSHPRRTHLDSDHDLEAPFQRENEDCLREVPLARTISEGPGLGHRLGFLSAGRVTFRRVSSGLYSRLSWAHPKVQENCDCDDLSDDEDDIVLTDEEGIMRNGDLDETSDDLVDVEMGVAAIDC